MASLNRLSTQNNLQLASVGLFVFIIVSLAYLNTLLEEDSVSLKEPGTISPPVPNNPDFCGEAVPVHYYDVFESLERELIVNTYFHSQTLLNIKRTNRYFPVIEPILKKNNIPDDFKYLALAESGFTNVVSPKGAAGFWQLLSGTAEDYGLEVNNEVDERYHLEKATEAACLYIKDSYKEFESWTIVAASYNIGRRGIQKQIERQGETDYYNLLLNEETARYVFRILALKAVMENPENYNIDVPANDRYSPIPFKLVTVAGPISNIGDFARENNTNYKLLKLLNPWLRDNTLQNKSLKEYSIKIPTTREP